MQLVSANPELSGEAGSYIHTTHPGKAMLNRINQSTIKSGYYYA